MCPSCSQARSHSQKLRALLANSLGNFAPQSFLTSGGGSVSAALALSFFRQPISFYNRKMLALVSVALRIARGGLGSLVASQLMTAAMGNSICTRLSSIRVFKANENT
ncbi:hypothetical protein KC19_5G176900 [Ceratodon purpureus]|uniref:Uncharacterized protein n=1 Tax=Ceratodon purpureus TaxID=3225 RepID=A0A8T0I477_CERPU|nr:hypothetical protein KC19_5G176900 [Ceratodon purpureus]